MGDVRGRVGLRRAGEGECRRCDGLRSALQRTSKGGHAHVWRVQDVDNTVKGRAVPSRDGGVISFYSIEHARERDSDAQMLSWEAVPVQLGAWLVPW